MKAVVSPESQLKGREERSGAELLAELTVRTEDGWSGQGREGRDGRMEGRKMGRALRLIDHFLSEWRGVESSRVERRGIQFEDWDFDGEEICREGRSEGVRE